MATLKIKLVLKLEYHADRKHDILGPGAFVEEWKVFFLSRNVFKIGLRKGQNRGGERCGVQSVCPSRSCGPHRYDHAWCHQHILLECCRACQSGWGWSTCLAGFQGGSVTRGVSSSGVESWLEMLGHQELAAVRIVKDGERKARPRTLQEGWVSGGGFSWDIFSCCQLPGPALPRLLAHHVCFAFSRADPAAAAWLLSEGSDVPPWAAMGCHCWFLWPTPPLKTQDRPLTSSVQWLMFWGRSC